jgi:PAS domain S-box-containing protein
MWEWDLRTGVNTWSENIWRLYGLAPHCNEASYDLWSETIHPEDRDRAQRTVTDAAMNGQGINFEYRVLEESGTIRWLLSRGKPITDESGKPIGYLGLVIDITERKKAEEASMEASKHLSLLTRVMRHDLKNQLLVLNIYANLLGRAKDGFEVAELQKKITRSILEMQNQLEFTKQYQELGHHAPEWLNIHELVTKAKGNLNSGELSIEEHGTDVLVLADPLLEKVVYNLIDNALRHSGAKCLTVTVEEEGVMKLIFEDDGEGISDDDRPHLFERGYGKNTGLGLFMSREILALTKMTIRETSVEDAGARFEILVPSGNHRPAK